MTVTSRQLKYRLLPILLTVLVSVGLVACSNNKEVGSGLETDLNDAINELNSSTTQPGGTTVAPVNVNPGEATTTSRGGDTTVTTAKVTTTIPADRQVTMTINADTSGKSQFEPTTLQARIGTPVIFKNLDSKVRWVFSPNGNFRSPDLQPGQEWIYRPNKTGTFELKDGTRPYVTGTLQVY